MIAAHQAFDTSEKIGGIEVQCIELRPHHAAPINPKRNDRMNEITTARGCKCETAILTQFTRLGLDLLGRPACQENAVQRIQTL
nr:hypothetical protein [Microvirga sp. VF16]